MTDGIIKKIKVTSSRGETVYDIGTAAANVEFSEGNEVVSGDKKLEDDLTSVVGKKALGSIYNTGYIYNDFIITQPSDIGERTLTMGANNITSGRYSFSIGSNIINSHINAGAIGSNLKTWGDNQLVIGELSEPNKNEGVATALSNYNFIVHNSNALWSPASIGYQSEAAFAVGGEKALFQVPIEIYGSLSVEPVYKGGIRTGLQVEENSVYINNTPFIIQKRGTTTQTELFTVDEEGNTNIAGELKINSQPVVQIMGYQHSLTSKYFIEYTGTDKPAGIEYTFTNNSSGFIDNNDFIPLGIILSGSINGEYTTISSLEVIKTGVNKYKAYFEGGSSVSFMSYYYGNTTSVFDIYIYGFYSKWWDH